MAGEGATKNENQHIFIVGEQCARLHWSSVIGVNWREARAVDVLGIANSAHQETLVDFGFWSAEADLVSDWQERCPRPLAMMLDGDDKREIERPKPIWPDVCHVQKRLTALGLRRFGPLSGDLTVRRRRISWSAAGGFRRRRIWASGLAGPCRGGLIGESRGCHPGLYDVAPIGAWKPNWPGRQLRGSLEPWSSGDSASPGPRLRRLRKTRN